MEEILPRKNSFIRPAVANVDLLVLLASCAIPQTEPFLIDRVLAIAGQQGVEPLICVNKNDLEPGEGLAGIYRRAGFRVVVTSAETGEGIDELRAALPGARAFHASCKTLLESGMTFRREGVPMGLPGLDEWHIQQTDADAVCAAKAAVMR